MTATAVAAAVHQDVDDLIAAVYGDEVMLKTTRLAERLGLRRDTVFAAVKRGELAFVRLSERRTMIPRESARRWLTERLGGAS